MKRCSACGYAHLEAGGTHLAELCGRCGAALDASSRIDGLVQLQNVSLKLAQRITCDEEERQRFGYNLVTAYRFPEVNGRLERNDAEVLCDDVPVLTLSVKRQMISLRKKAGLTQERMAELLGTRKSNISRLGNCSPGIGSSIKNS